MSSYQGDSMNVSSVNSATNSYWNNLLQIKYNQQVQDFRGLSSAVQSGDMSTAQTALAAVEKDIQNDPNSPLAAALSDPNSQASKDFQALQTAVQSNDATGAQSAFAAFKQDLSSIHHHHHHRKDGSSTNTANTNAASSSTDSILLDEQI